MPAWDINFQLKVNADDPALVRLVARIRALSSVIREIPLPPAVQGHIDALNIMRAVRGTTGIEGAQLSEDEVRSIMTAPSNKAVLRPERKREEDEARNAQELMYRVAEILVEKPETPLTEELIRGIHHVLTKDIGYLNNLPGGYRKTHVAGGDYIAPRPETVPGLMTDFITFFNRPPANQWDPVIRALAAHFYVVSIHPFGDGNGRTARGVESFLLYQAGVNARGFYSLANYYYRHREEYVGMLNHVRFEGDGDLTPFIRFGLEGLEQELASVHTEIIQEVKWISFRDFARETLTGDEKLGTRAGDRLLHFLLGMGRDSISLRELRKGRHGLSHLYRGVTERTLARDIRYLRERELVIEEGGWISANLAIMTRFVPPGQHRGLKDRLIPKPP